MPEPEAPAGRRGELAEVMHDFDFLLTPSARGEAPPSLESTGDAVFNLAWPILGVPCITVPHGRGPAGLPLAVQLVGHFDADSALLGLPTSAGQVRGITGSGGDAGRLQKV